MSTPDRANRNARGLATARAIERAAVRLATEQGLDRITVDAVCAAAGITQRTFFNHFPTKEDALLGLDLPGIDDLRAREYLADPSIGVLAGVLAVIEPPRVHLDDPAFFIAQLRLLAGSPPLRAKQGERFDALAVELEHLVLLKLRTIQGPLTPEAALREQAATVVAMGAGVMGRLAQQLVAHPTPELTVDPRQGLDSLAPIWARLL